MEATEVTIRLMWPKPALACCFLLSMAVLFLVSCDDGEDRAAAPHSTEEHAAMAAEEGAIEEIYDFGEVSVGVVLEKEWELRNDSSKPLRILNVRKSCSCNEPTLSTKLIEPGGVCKVGLRLVTAGQRIAKASYKIFLTTDDPERKTLVYGVTADILVRAQFFPHNIAFEKRRGASQTRAWSVVSNSDKDIVVSSVTMLHPDLLKATVGEKYLSGTGFVTVPIEIEATDAIPLGKLESEMEVQVSTLPGEKIVIPVSVDVRPDYDLFPKSVFLGFMKRGSTVTKTVKVVLHDAGEIVRASSKNGFVDCSVDPKGNGEYTLQVTFQVKDSLASGTIEDSVVLESTMDSAKEIQVPVSGFVLGENKNSASSANAIQTAS